MKRKSNGSRLLVLALALGLGMGTMAMQPNCPGMPGADDDDDGLEGAIAYITKVDASGGMGDTGIGGQGGDIIAAADFPSVGLTIHPFGSMERRFILEKPLPADLGYNPLIVNGDMVIDVYINQADADANALDGEYLMFLQDTGLYMREGSGMYDWVSGLKVNMGATLTLGLNWNQGGASGQDAANLELLNDVINNGTIMPKTLDTGNLNGGVVETRDGGPATALDAGAMRIYTLGSIYNNGKVLTTGADATVMGGRGGFGGGLSLLADNWAVNRGTMDCSGGHGMGAGDGGDACWFMDQQRWIGLNSTIFPVHNLGVMRANGGDGASGGFASEMYIESEFSYAYNGGRLIFDGGQGWDGGGGFGGSVGIYSGAAVVNEGALHGVGGDANTDVNPGPFIAGFGGGVELVGLTKSINTGRVDVDAGDGTGNCAGGIGGIFIMSTDSGEGQVSQSGYVSATGGDALGAGQTGGPGGAFLAINDAGPISVRGTMKLHGGDGDIGGPGGDFVVDGGKIDLIGYGEMSARGGDGNIGNKGGNIQLYSLGDASVITRLVTQGGSGPAGGGNGGQVQMQANIGDFTFNGAIHNQGGNADAGNAGAGGVILFTAAPFSIFNMHADLFAGGGDVRGAGAFTGGAGGIIACIMGYLDLNGVADVSGGNARDADFGGNAGVIDLDAVESIMSRARLNASGGDANDTTGAGGDGGIIDLMSGADPTDHVGPFDATGGDGFTPGADGTFTVDGVPIFP